MEPSSNQRIEKGQRIDLLVTAVYNRGQFCHFFAQIESPAADKLAELTDRVSVTIENNILTTEPSVGECVWARFQEDGKWYRARIDKVEPAGIHVYFIDYGSAILLNADISLAINDFVAICPEHFKRFDYLIFGSDSIDCQI